MSSREVHLYIAASLDGYLAGPGDTLNFLSRVERPGEDYGYAAFMESVDTVVLGRKTYDKVLSMGVPFPHADRACFVVTRTPREPIGRTIFHAGDPVALIEALRQQAGGRIFIDGGAQLVHALLCARQIDAITVSVIPVLLGDGIRLFQAGGVLQDLSLTECRNFPSGLVQLTYRVDRRA